MTSMYRGRERFNREQLVFVMEAALCGAFDKVDGAMPSTEGDKPYFEKATDVEKEGLKQYQWGAVYQVCSFVAILWAQLNNDGMGTSDWSGYDEWESMVEKFIKDKWDNPSLSHPDCRALAEKIIDENFDEYLGTNKSLTITFSHDVKATTTVFDSEGNQTDQYSETFEAGQEIELDPERQWGLAVGGDAHLVTLFPAYPNNENYTVPLWAIEQEDRDRLEMGPAIPAEIYSDDAALRAEFDALPWFRQASDDQLVDIAHIDYSGDYEADEVARWMAEYGSSRDPATCMRAVQVGRSINAIFDYPGSEDACGFEVHIDREAALAFIESERPHLLGRIEE